MPRQSEWQEAYKNPFGNPKKVRGRPEILGKSLFKRRAEGLVPFGHFRDVGLQSPATRIGVPDLERRAVPRSQYPLLTVLERIFLKELLRRHLRPGVDFVMQESIEGGKTMPGGYAPDFTLFLPGGKTSVEVQGDVYHKGIVPAARDEVKEMFLKSVGFVQVLYIEEQTLRSDDLTQQWLRREIGL